MFVGEGCIFFFFLFFLTKEGPFNKVKFSSSQKEAGETAMEMPGRGVLAERIASTKALGARAGLVCSRLQGVDRD